MSDFRTKLLGLAAFATIFTGLSYGQVSCLTGVGGTPEPTSLNTVSPILDRGESEADLVSDVILLCPASTATANGQLTLFLSLPVSSKAVAAQAPTAGTPPTAGTFSGSGVANSEAVLQICPVQALGTGCTSATTGITVAGTWFVQGFVSGSTVTFSGVQFPAAFTAQISNIRVNLTGAGITTTPTAITESIFAGTNGLATVVYSNVTVGYGLKSLTTTLDTAVPASGLYPVTNYTVCVGNTGTAASFGVTVAETFGGFFKTQTGGGVIQNGEQGSLINPAGAAAGTSGASIGTAASGTEFTVTLGNIPSSATVYFKTAITNGTGTITLTSGTAITSGTYSGYTAFTPTAGAITATYQVTASSSASVESFDIPVAVTFAANSAAAQGPMTFLPAYAPVAALTGQATTVPDFAASSATPFNGSVITVCQTSLLFPFVTNQLGYDTGIVLANTSVDNLGIGGKSIATATAGTCNLFFYGAGAPTTQPVVAPGGSQAAGTTNAFTLSSVAPGFQGYMIATCSYLYGHGFGFLTDGATAGNAAVAQGFIAEVLANPRTTSTGTPEAITF